MPDTIVNVQQRFRSFFKFGQYLAAFQIIIGLVSWTAKFSV